MTDNLKTLAADLLSLEPQTPQETPETIEERFKDWLGKVFKQCEDGARERPYLNRNNRRREPCQPTANVNRPDHVGTGETGSPFEQAHMSIAENPLNGVGSFVLAPAAFVHHDGAGQNMEFVREPSQDQHRDFFSEFLISMTDPNYPMFAPDRINERPVED